jgi:gamma-glutamyltranspeptidase/glutathione hydrolase
MLSSMTPTFLHKDNRVAVLGTPGGSRIISMVLLATLAFADGATAAQMTALPRFHHQFIPDRIAYEAGAFTAGLETQLRALGHELALLQAPYGNMQVVILNTANQKLTAASDPRGEGAAEVRKAETRTAATREDAEVRNIRNDNAK